MNRPKKTNSLQSKKGIDIMEAKAISMLQTILKRRGQEYEKKEVASSELQRVNEYLLGTTPVIASQKDKLTERDIEAYVKEYTNRNYKSFIIISKSPASENVLKTVRGYADRIQFYDIQELQIDITTHRMYMPHYIYNEKFIADNPMIAKEYKIKSPQDELPRIDSQDIVVRLIGAVPGDIVYIRRHSDTNGYSHYWRLVVQDANLTE